jgi:transketolase
MPSRRELANAIRALSMDAVQKAKSGHPGAPMGMADIAEVLWNDYLRHNPGNPGWFNRDRFVLSNGHASMLLYSLLHLSGYDLSIEDLKSFRQLGSRTPGHPENELTPGVETTTGPLGQGLANAVGMALAEKRMAAEFNSDGLSIVDHYTYVFAGDGCLMEGISHEACSLAGTLKLGKLIAFYDDNGISIDGETKGWYTEDVAQRFAAYGWHVVGGVDGHDPEAVRKAIDQARAETDRPSLILCKTVIGWGSPNKAGTAASHGAALGDDEVALVREKIGWSHPPFEVPQDVYQAWSAADAGLQAEQEWNNLLDTYEVNFPEKADEFKRRVAGDLPRDWAARVEEYIAATDDKAETTASRKAFKATLDGLAGVTPELIGGSADLSVSNLTQWSDAEVLTPQTPGGNYVFYGVREFGMNAIMNGIAVHGGCRPFGGTFLTFSDYGRNAIRLAALMKAPTVFVFSHDSIGLGEDGPTHQPVEHLAALRYIPNLSVWRPCDAVETAVAWRESLERRDGPTAVVTSRQNLTHQSRTKEQLALIRRGGYILLEPEREVEAIVMATGSEVGIAVEAAQALNEQGRGIRVVSMPSTDVFDAQDPQYRESVLPSALTTRLAVEAGTSDYWRRYVGLQGDVLGLDEFGHSAPAKQVFEHFGFNAENVTERLKALLG